MTDDEQRADPAESGDVGDVVEDVLGGPADRGGAATSTDQHGVVTGDEQVDFALADCEIVAQAYDDESGGGTRLYRVDDDRFALSRFRRSAAQDWVESLAAHGRLTVDPVELSADPVRESVVDRDADPLSDVEWNRVRDAYDEACERAVWAAIESASSDGLVVRGELACVEDPTWRQSVRPSLPDGLDADQVDAVLDALMDARPDVDWSWYQLYAVYVSHLRFEPDP